MNKILFTNVNLIDGTKDMKLQPLVDVLIVDNKIFKIGKGLEDKEAKVIDLCGKYMTPGLINLHVHLPGSGKAPFKNSNSKKLVKLITKIPFLHPVGVMIGKKAAVTSLRSGVTTLRAVGGVSNFDTILRDKINKGKIEASRLYVANSAVSVPGGHMEGTVSVSCNSIEEAVKFVDKLAEQKVDLIKIMITGGVIDAEKRGEPGVLKMQPDMVKACCDEAHRLGYKVAAHVESNEGVKIAIENGVDTIEHGGQFDDEDLNIVKDRNVSFVATFSPAVPLAILSDEETGCNEFARFNTRVVLKHILLGVKKALENDVPVGLGTDTGCPFVTHYGFYRELVWYKELTNVSNEYALYTGTLLNAKILGKDSEIGSIEEGKLADLVVFEKNPLEDLNNLQNPNLVMKDGKIVKNLKIKKDPFIISCLDKIMKFDLDEILEEVADY